MLRADSFKGRTLGRIDVAATGPHAPIPPGLPRLPGPGQYYASPALGELLRSIPAAQLADRFPGQQVGTIGPAALPGPDSLIIVMGADPARLSKAPGAAKVTAITTVTPSRCNGTDCVVRAGLNSDG